MKSLKEHIRQAARHGKVRSGIILGIRMARLGLNELSIGDPSKHRRCLVIIVETDRCLPDAIELVTGCRLGNRTLKFRDMGKMAATFVDLQTDRAIRVAAKDSANHRASEMFPKVAKEEALGRAYRRLSDKDLFTRKFVRVALAPEDIPDYWAPRVVCEGCGESIAFGKEIHKGQRTLCGACSGHGYYEPL